MNSYPTPDLGESLAIHRGAIDQTTITTKSPPEVMKRVATALQSMGITTLIESERKYRCTRAKRQEASVKEICPITTVPECTDAEVADVATPKAPQPKFSLLPSSPLKEEEEEEEEEEQTHIKSSSPGSSSSDITILTTPSSVQQVAYGDEPGDEVRFSVELTRLEGLLGTFSLDIRRLKGDLRSYKFIYDTLRDRINLQS